MKPNNDDNVSGFLDGYKARNIAILEDTLQYEIRDLEKFLFFLVELHKDNPNAKTEYQDLKNIESDFENRNSDILTRLINFGGDFYNFLDKISFDFKNDNKGKIDDIILKYLDISEKSKNQEIIKRALSLASKV